MARKHGDPIGTIGSTSVRLADWRPVNEAYQRRYVPVKPQDRFVSGQQFEFTADLEFRDWVIDDFSGGIGLSDKTNRWYRWNPGDGQVARMQNFWPSTDGPAIRALNGDYTVTDAGGPPDQLNGGWLFTYNGSLWTGFNDTVYKWQQATEDWDATGVGTGWTGGATIQMISVANPGNGSIYITFPGGEIRKVDDLEGTPANSTHYAASGTGDDWVEDPPLVAFNGRVFGLDGNDLYELDLTTADTRTLVSDLTAQSTWTGAGTSINDGSFYQRLTVSDVGPVWWVRTDAGRTEFWEYNVGSDTTDRIGVVPTLGTVPHQLFWAYGFLYLTYASGDISLNSDFYVYYQRGSQSGTIGPVPGPTGYRPDPIRGAGRWCGIVGVLHDTLFLFKDTALYGYNLGSGGWGVYGDLLDGVADGIASGRGNGFVWGEELFVAGLKRSSSEEKIVRFQTQEGMTTRGETNVTNPLIRTGMWHFGYPNVEKIFTEITVDLWGHMVASDTLTLRYYVDGATSATGTDTFSGNATPPLSNTFTISDNTNTRRGTYMDIEFEQTADDSTNTSRWGIQAIRARATSAQSRREWQLVLDASDSASAGLEQNDVAWLQELEDLKTNKAVVSFSDPWQQYDDGTADTFDVIVEEVFTPAATHDSDDQREAIVVLREVGLV